MKEKPRPSKEKLVSGWMLTLILIISATAAIFPFGVFAFFYYTTGDVIFARTMSFVTLGLDSLVYVFSVRSLMTPFWKSSPFQNKWLLVAVGAGLCLQFIPFLTEGTRQFFGVTGLKLEHWLLALGLTMVMFLIVEVFKTVCKFNLVKKRES